MNDESFDYETFDLSKLVTTKNIANMYQSGNWLHCISETGQSFRQGIPSGKVLNKDTQGNWVLEDLNIRV